MSINIVRSSDPYMTIKTDKGFSVLENNSRNCISRKDWEELKELMDSYFASHTDEEIEVDNENTREQELKSFKEHIDNQKRQKKKEKGYVYFIGNEVVGVKIGYTNNTKKRLSALNVSSPTKLNLLGSIETYEMDKLESYFHEKFSSYRLNGEWFDITHEQVSKILEQKEWL